MGNSELMTGVMMCDVGQFGAVIIEGVSMEAGPIVVLKSSSRMYWYGRFIGVLGYPQNIGAEFYTFETLLQK